MDYKNSCLMLSISLYSGLDLTAAFKDEDLTGTGIELDSHITIFYSPNKIVPKEGLIDNIRTLDTHILDKLEDQNKYKVLDYFELGKFENDTDFLVLKLQEGNDLYNSLGILNTGLTSVYDIESTFKNYTPHVTLAELEPGKAKNYMFSPVLNSILENALFGIDDFLLSYGTEHNKYKHFQITSKNAVQRYFRQQELEKNKRYYDSL